MKEFRAVYGNGKLITVFTELITELYPEPVKSDHLPKTFVL
jgi:hypothetical protein